jgi:hypothetical protein
MKAIEHRLQIAPSLPPEVRKMLEKRYRHERRRWEREQEDARKVAQARRARLQQRENLGLALARSLKVDHLLPRMETSRQAKGRSAGR